MAISRENIRLIGQLSTIGFSFVLAIVMGFGGGYLLDGWLGTAPWLTFLGFFAGLAAGVLNVYRVMKYASSTTSSRPSAADDLKNDPRPPGGPSMPGKTGASPRR